MAHVATRDAVQSLGLHHDEIVETLSSEITMVVQKLRIQISQVDYNCTIGKKSSQEQVETLLKVVKRKTQLFDDFCDTIDEMKHHHLAEKLRRKF